MDTVNSLSIIVDVVDASFLNTSELDNVFTSDMTFKQPLEFDFDILVSRVLN